VGCVQARFTKAILAQKAGIELDLERIFSQTVSGQPKAEVLAMFLEQHSECTEFHFVEDKMSTLHKVIGDDRLDKYQLHLVDWGYNTEEEREVAQQSDRIQLMSSQDFEGLLKAR
jgi:hypothetical protein